ncbi:hypothetical protein ACFVAE_11380 [Microbacterium sp. NPDC057659]|uniref:hypothetical protein n=1 Tax=unclassified Microbacterium TaxID=2609290 RepID=UPI00366E6AEA
MNKTSIWTVLGVIAAVVIAWWIVSALFSVVWFIVKLAMVAVVAVLVYAVIRMLTRSRED